MSYGDIEWGACLFKDYLNCLCGNESPSRNDGERLLAWSCRLLVKAHRRGARTWMGTPRKDSAAAPPPAHNTAPLLATAQENTGNALKACVALG